MGVDQETPSELKLTYRATEETPLRSSDAVTSRARGPARCQYCAGVCTVADGAARSIPKATSPFAGCEATVSTLPARSVASAQRRYLPSWVAVYVKPKGVVVSVATFAGTVQLTPSEVSLTYRSTAATPLVASDTVACTEIARPVCQYEGSEAKVAVGATESTPTSNSPVVGLPPMASTFPATSVAMDQKR